MRSRPQAVDDDGAWGFLISGSFPKAERRPTTFTYTSSLPIILNGLVSLPVPCVCFVVEELVYGHWNQRKYYAKGDTRLRIVSWYTTV
jgi:hypothetical protein